MRWMALHVAVEDRGKLRDPDFVTRFFAGFACRSHGRRLTNIGPAPRKRPATVLEFADQKYATIFEGGDTHIDFGSGIPGLLRKQIFKISGARMPGACSHHLRGDAANFFVTVNIEFFLGVGEARLRDSLKPARPGEPLRDGHTGILAAQLLANKSQRLQTPYKSKRDG